MAPSLLDLLVPEACVACRSPGRWPLCGACRRTLPFLAQDCCPRCALPRPCGRRCPGAGSAFDGAWAPFAHEGVARAVVIAMKYRGGRALADLLAAPMAAVAPDGLFAAGRVLVPVPASASRARLRGYNQAAVLAQALGRRAGPAVADVLRRHGAGHSQVGAGRSGRAVGGGRITARRPAPPECLLVDDVHTTGATLDACARALRAAGAQSVSAVTATRTLTDVRL